jgi:hypothetical protein
MITKYCLKGKYKTTPGSARRYETGLQCALKGLNNCKALTGLKTWTFFIPGALLRASILSPYRAITIKNDYALPSISH